MSSALVRGRTLDPDAVKMAQERRVKRIVALLKKVKDGMATIRDRKELIYKWGAKLEGTKAELNLWDYYCFIELCREFDGVDLWWAWSINQPLVRLCISWPRIGYRFIFD